MSWIPNEVKALLSTTFAGFSFCVGYLPVTQTLLSPQIFYLIMCLVMVVTYAIFLEKYERTAK